MGVHHGQQTQVEDEKDKEDKVPPEKMKARQGLLRGGPRWRMRWSLHADEWWLTMVNDGEN